MIVNRFVVCTQYDEEHDNQAIQFQAFRLYFQTN